MNRENWQVKKISDICTFFNDGNWIESKDQSDDGIRLIQTGNIGNGFYKDKEDKAKYISPQTFEELKCIEIFEGDCLISRLPDPIGRACIIPQIRERAITAVDCSILRFKSLVIPSFFVYFTQSNSYSIDIEKKSTGSTRKRISRKNLGDIKIPVPPLPIQEKIVKELDTLHDILTKKKEQLKELDKLAQATFYDMFGDPVENEKGWDIERLEKLCSKITDGTHDTPDRLREGVKFITGKHIRPFVIDYDNSDYVLESAHQDIYKRCNPEYEDILYTNIGVNMGTAAMNTVNYEFSMKNVALLKQKRNILNGRYLEHLLNNSFFKKKIIGTGGAGGAQTFLSLKQIKNIIIPVPALSLQNQFAAKIEAIEKQKELINLSIKDVEQLIGYTMDKYFN